MKIDKKSNYIRTLSIRKKLSKSIIKFFLADKIKKYNKYKKLWNKIPDIYWAWLTGFWEGEGCITIYSRTKHNINHKEIRIMLAQNDYNILKNICKKLHVGHVNKSNTCWSFNFSNKGIVKLFLEKIKPFLKIRRRKIKVNQCLKLIKIN